MNKYLVDISEQIHRTLVVEAADKQEAEHKAMAEQLNNGASNAEATKKLYSAQVVKELWSQEYLPER